MSEKSLRCEGDVYKTITVADHTFTIKYGYYTESERTSDDPMPIFPDFDAEPLYSLDGYPLVLRIQEACEHYVPHDGIGDGWCADCTYYPSEYDEIGICRCEGRRKSVGVGNGPTDGCKNCENIFTEEEQ